jgi:serine/threonine-protein kinase
MEDRSLGGGLDAAAMSDSVLGERVLLGPFVIESRLAQTSSGATYVARDGKLPGLRIVVKTQPASSPEDVQARFEQQVYAADQVGSHRVARPLGHGTLPDGTPFIAREWIEGRTLAEEIAETGALPVSRTVFIATAVAHTLAVAHDCKVILRDLTPSNVLLTKQGSREDLVRIADFGSARVRGGAQRITTEGPAVHGSLGHMAPETVLGIAVDGRADVYSLGAVMFEMLTGRALFETSGSSFGQASRRAVTEDSPPPSSLRPSACGAVPAQLDAIVRRALDRNPDTRPTMARVLADLQSFYATALAPHQSPEEIAREMSAAVPMRPSETQAPTLSTPKGDVGNFLAAVGGAAPVSSEVTGTAQPETISPPRWGTRRRTTATVLALFGALATGIVVGLLAARPPRQAPSTPSGPASDTSPAPTLPAPTEPPPAATVAAPASVPSPVRLKPPAGRPRRETPAPAEPAGAPAAPHAPQAPGMPSFGDE